jgi:hypothetical protein
MNKKLPPKHFSTFILFVVGLLFFSACKKIVDETPQQEAAINVVNASPGNLAFNFFMNKRLFDGPALNYMDETGYLLTFHGIRDFDASAAGTAQSSIKATFELKKRGYHTIFITGENSSLSILFTEDDLSSPPAGKAKIRFVQLSPDSGTLDLGIKNGVNLFSGQAFKSASNFSVIDPASYTLQLKNPDGSIISETDVEVKPGVIYTVWSKGLKAGTGGTPIGIQFRSIN